MRKKLNHSSSNSFPVGIYLLMIGVIVTYFILMAGRVDAKHFINVLRINTPLGIAAIAQTLVLLIGGIDLSIGSVITTTNIVACSIMAGDSKKIPITILVCVVMAFTLLTIAAKGMTNVNKQRLEKMKNENLTKVA